MNFVTEQILWCLTLLLFLIICFFVARVFSQIRFARVLFEILLCVIIFIYILAFRVNF